MHKEVFEMKLLKSFLYCLFALQLVNSVVTATPLSQTDPPDFYVKPTATGSGGCSSWANACGLQTALTNAITGDVIWVAEGTYYPTTTTDDRTDSFQLKNGVAIYGGFPAEGSDWIDRDWVTNTTTLSGDIDIDGVNTGNSYHVVTGFGVTGSAILNGFTISGGNANGSVPLDRGGGIYNRNSSTPTLTNVIFSGNSAYFGGGMFNNDSGPFLNNVTFYNNEALIAGGGIYNEYSSPTLYDVTFTQNKAINGSGGGMYNSTWSGPTLNKVTFSGNSACFGGGMFNETNFPPVLTNVTFSANIVGADATESTENVDGFGGGMYNFNTSNLILTNVTFSGNTAAGTNGSGGGIYNMNSSPQLRNAIVYGNTPTINQIYSDSPSSPTITYSDIQGDVYAGIGNINSDPLLGPLADNGGFTQTHALGPGSPAIDAGDPENCPSVDQRTFPRPIDGDAVSGARCDMGAFEFDTYPLNLVIVGNGQVFKSPDKSIFLYGEEVILTPVADAGSTFYGWSGAVSGSDNPLTVKIINDTTITAAFSEDEYTLITAVNPPLSGTIARSSQQTKFLYNDPITLTANAEPGWKFIGWSGDASGTTNPLELNIQGDTSITAEFERINSSIYLPLVLK